MDAVAQRGLDYATMSSAQTLITIATYNEIDNLPRLVDEIHAVLPDAEILVVDDNSPDGTGRWCDERAAADCRLRSLHRERKLGLGTATIAALRYGLERGYRFLINMDADFSHHPRYLPALLGWMDRSPLLPGDGQGVRATGSPRLPGEGQGVRGAAIDVMIGSRYVPGGGIEGWPWQRHAMSRGVNFLSRWLLGLRPHDCSGAFRCYRTEVLARINFDDFRSRGYSVQEEILWRLKRAGARFGETPIVFVDRRRGASKISWRESASSLGTILRLGVEQLFSAGGLIRR